jgi:hypothetical protein
MASPQLCVVVWPVKNPAASAALTVRAKKEFLNSLNRESAAGASILGGKCRCFWRLQQCGVRQPLAHRSPARVRASAKKTCIPILVPPISNWASNFTILCALCVSCCPHADHIESITCRPGSTLASIPWVSLTINGSSDHLWVPRRLALPLVHLVHRFSR